MIGCSLVILCLATTPDALEAFLKVFVDAGVDCLHVSQRRYWEPEFPEIDGENGLNGAGWAAMP